MIQMGLQAQLVLLYVFNGLAKLFHSGWLEGRAAADVLHMEWVLNTRYNPAVDTVIIDNVVMRGALDPSVPKIDGVKMGSKIVIDATRRYDEADFSLPPRATMMKALDSWKESGLPEFKIPKRAQCIRAAADTGDNFIG